jgi:hypothetical protein
MYIGSSSEKKLFFKLEFLLYPVNQIEPISVNKRRSVASSYPSNQTVVFLESIFTYLLIFKISRPPIISVTAERIGSKKLGYIGGLMVSQTPCPDRNPRGARGLFGPQKNKKSYFLDFFSRTFISLKGWYFSGLLTKIIWSLWNFIIKIYFRNFEKKLSKSEKSHTKIT